MASSVPLCTFKKVTDFLEVLTQDFLFAGVSQHVGWVDGSKGFGGAKIVEPTTDFGDTFLDAQDGADGGSAQAANQARLDGLNLAIEEGRAGVNLVLFRSAIPWGAALDDIADVDLLAFQANGFHHAVQKLPCSPHEGETLFVFVSARTLTNEHQLSVRVPLAKHNRLASERQSAAAAVAEILPNLLQRLGTGTWRGGGLE